MLVGNIIKFVTRYSAPATSFSGVPRAGVALSRGFVAPPRPRVALSKVASDPTRPESIYPRPGVALSRGEKGLSRLVVAPSRHRGGLSSLGGALSGAAESAAKPNNISLDQIRKRTIVVT